MQHVKVRRALALLLSLVMVLGLITLPVAAEEVGETTPAALADFELPDIRDLMNNPAPLYELPDLVRSFRGVVRVTVELASPTTVDLGLVDLNLSPDSELAHSLHELAAEHRTVMRTEQHELQAQITELYPDALFRYSYTNLMNGFQAQIPYGLIEEIEALDGVLAVHIHLDVEDENTLEQSDPNSSDFGWIYEEFELDFIPLDGEDAEEILADLMPVSLIAPLSCHGAWDVTNVREAWNLGFTGGGRVIGILDTMIRDTHQAYSYMDPTIAAEQPEGFISRETIMQRVQDNVDTLNFLDLDGWESWFHWDHPDRNLATSTANPGAGPEAGGNANPTGFRDPDVRERLLAGAFWRSDKVPFNLDYFHGRYAMPPAIHAHGNQVSSIALGNPGPNMINGFLGMAHDAQLFGLNVYSTGLMQDPNVQETDDGAFAAIEDSITLGVHAFNMSYGTRHGTTTKHHVLSRVGYQSAFIRAAELGIAITASAGNQHRNIDMDSLVGARPAWLPNAGTVGFPNELFPVISVAAGQSPRNLVQSFNLTNISFANAAGDTIQGLESEEERVFVAAPLEIRDHNVSAVADSGTGWASVPLGVQLPQEYQVVNVGTGTAVEIAAAGNLTGRVALITSSADLVAAQERVSAAGAVAAIIANVEDRVVVMTNFTDRHQIEHMTDDRFYDPFAFPIIGKIRSSHATALRTALDAGVVNVSFASRAVTIPGNADVTRADIGPMGFTCWGVTDSLRLSPDIMGPGGNVLMANAAASNMGYGTGSGTSMSAPAVNGILVLTQQSVMQRIEEGYFEHVTGLFANLQPGTLEFNLLVNMLAMSTARVTQVYHLTPTNPTAVTVTDVPNPNAYRFHSPRRQGSGMVNAGYAVQSNVVLHNGNVVTYNPYTGEAPRSAVNIGSGLTDQFEFNFVLENFNNAPRTFNVSATLQTDATIELTNGVVALPTGQQTDGSEIESIPAARMRVANLSGDARIVSPAANINRYSTNAGATWITVPARSSTVVTISVDARDVDFDRYEAIFPNGMFLEGFVWFDPVGSTPAFEHVSIPFLGFYGSWFDAPIFDVADAYTDISDLEVTDLAHPMFHTTAMHATAPRDRSNDGGMLEISDMGEIVLGANLFTDAAWGGYAMVGRGTTPALTRPGAPGGASTGQTATLGGNLVRGARNYMNDMRAAGHLNREFIAFSPTDDGFADSVYANLMLLRNAKAIAVVIRDAEGEIINVLGPEFDFFRTRTQYDHGQWHWATLQDGRHFRNMAWDGTDFHGNIVSDGQYFYEVRAMLEYEFLAMVNETPGQPTDMAALTEVLITSPTVQYKSFPVFVDTQGPEITLVRLFGDLLAVQAESLSGIQAIAVYYADAELGEYRLLDLAVLSTARASHGLLLGDHDITLDPSRILVQVVDFALNVTTVREDTVIDTRPLSALLAEAEAIEPEGYTEVSFAALQTAIEHARTVLNTVATQSVLDLALSALQAAIDGLEEVPSEPVYHALDFSGHTVYVRDGYSIDPAQVPEPPDGYIGWALTPGGDVITDWSAIAVADSITFYAVPYTPPEPQPEFHPAYMFGDPAGNFFPRADITRAQVAAILARTMIDGFVDDALPEGMDSFDAFNDVNEDNWFYYYVAWAYTEGLVQGDGRGRFLPRDYITREQLAAMLARTIEHEIEIGEIPFPDRADISTWATDYVYIVFHAELMIGDTRGNFRPRTNIMRAEVATAVNRMLGRVDSREAFVGLGAAIENLENARDFPDIREAAWYFPSVLGAANDHYLTRDDDGVIDWKYIRIQQ